MKSTALLLLTAAGLCAQNMDLPLMPWPQKVTQGQGRFAITPQFTIRSSGASEGRVPRAIARALLRLSMKTGIPVQAPGSPQHVLEVSYSREAGRYPQLGDDESYRLSVTSSS